MNKDDTKIVISPMGFPSQSAPDVEKASIEFGLRVGQAISGEWFSKGGGQCRFHDQLKSIHMQRLYARGEQPIQKYKNELGVDGDMSYLNLDWTPVPVIPKFVDIVVNGLQGRMFKPKAYAQDAMSQAKRSKYQDMIEGQMAAKDLLLKIKKETGVNTFTMDPDALPNNDEEMSLFMQLNYKPAIEIAEEEALCTIFDENHYMDLRPRMDYDIASIGWCVGKHQFLRGAGVVLDYVDPATVIHSYTEDPHFKDCFYWGEIKTVHVTELLKINPDLTKEELTELSKLGASWYSEYNMDQLYNNSMFANDSCTLLYYNYKTTKRVVYKKKLLDNGNARVIEKGDSFNPPQELLDGAQFEVLEKTIDVWYDGVMVLGTNKVIKWELSKNMVRPKSSAQHAIPNYVAVAPRMYKGVIESLVRRMIPFADLIQITHLKLQQVVAKIVPDGVFIDADGINEVDLGNGAAYTPEDALKMYFQTGSVIGRSYTQEGEFNNARVPIQELNTSPGANKSDMLIKNYNHYLNMIRDVTGLNEAATSSPDPDSLVGLQKMAALNSNTATRHILDGSLYVYRTLAEAISLRVADILEYSDFADDFANKIGKYNSSILNEIKDLYASDFGIFIEVSPDEEEKAQLETNILAALNKNNIDIEDAIDIREIKNLKLANQLLKMKRLRKLARDEQNQMQQQAMTAQQALKAQEMAANVKIQSIQQEMQAKIEIRKVESAMRIEELKAEAELKSNLMKQEFDYNMELTNAEASVKRSIEGEKETKKDNRLSQQSTEQSKLINQRQNNLAPIEFRSENSSMDGLNLND